MKYGILEIFNKIMDNRFYQTLISVGLTIISYMFLEDDMLIIKKLGYLMTSILFLISWLLITGLIIFLYKQIKKIYIKICNKNFNSKLNEIQNRESLENLWSRTDKMSKKEKDNLIYFVKNNNKPLLVRDRDYPYDHLLSSDWVHMSEYSGDGKIIKKIRVATEEKEVNRNIYGEKIENREICPRYQYILREDIYIALKYSFEEYGRISHFY